MQRIAFFEDDFASQFSPIALLRPVFELRCGHWSLRERFQYLFPQSVWGASLRPALAEVYAEEHPTVAVNQLEWLAQGPTLCINGRWLPEFTHGQLQQAREQFTPGTAGWIDDQLAWVVVDPDELTTELAPTLADSLLLIAQQKSPCRASGAMLQYPWDLLTHQPRQLERDFTLRASTRPEPGSIESGTVALLGSPADVFVSPSAHLDPYVVLDVRNGPIWIEPQANIQAFTRIEGPAYIGAGTQTFRANIRAATTLGPVCRVGGEVEHSILHGHANKYHDGFLGHSYICPWVNLGALTTNSDLKNDYSPVSVVMQGQSVQTHANKVGCFIGDHTKTALCSLFNTGSTIGVGCLVLPNGGLLPKHIPSFTRIWHGRIEALPDATQSMLDTAEYAMRRREQLLTPAQQRLLRTSFEVTRIDREQALQRATSPPQSTTHTP